MRIFLTLALSLSALCSAHAGKVSKNCTFNGVPLYGSVRIVSGAADFDVRLVRGAADLNVLKTSTSGRRCGLWQIVNSPGMEDFTVRYVNSPGMEDFTVRYVNSPGMEGL